MRAAAGFNGPDSFGRQRVMSGQKLAVFLREDIIGDGGDAVVFAQALAELQHQRSLTAADWPANPDRKRPPFKIAIQR